MGKFEEILDKETEIDFVNFRPHPQPLSLGRGEQDSKSLSSGRGMKLEGGSSDFTFN
jgi:hypothetical protein